MNLRPNKFPICLPVLCCLFWFTFAVFQASHCCGQKLNSPAPDLKRLVPAGVGHYSPQRWASVAADVTNRANESREVVVATYFVEDPNTQYGRRIWLPPKSRRRTSFLLMPPGEVAPSNGRYEIKTMVVDSTDGGTMLRADDGRMLDGRFLPADKRPIVTKLISDLDEDADEAVIELSMAARIATGRSRLVSEYQDEFLPAIGLGMQGMDQLILSGDRITDDLAGLTAVRQWLHAGGRLWIMLDQLQPETVTLLLGESFEGQFIDRVGLTELLLERVSDESAFPNGEVRVFEEPVDFVRVIVDGAQVSYSVNGWPAAFWQKFGHGEVLFTTLGPHGWMRLWTPSDPKSKNPQFVSKFVPTKPMRALADRFFQRRRPPPVEPDQLEPILTEQIGYRIVSRGTAAAVLGSFCGGVLIAGIVLIRRGRLELLGWLGPAVAALAALVIGLMGASSKRGVPNTLAELQFVQTVPGTDDLHVTGLASLYFRDSSKEVIGATQGGVFVPDTGEARGNVSRMLWTDLDCWRWENLTLPPGARTASFEFMAKSSTPVQASGRFGPGGFDGRVETDFVEDLSDVIIGTPSRESLAVSINHDGTFSASNDNVLPPRQFIADTLLSDKQRRRQDVYRLLMPLASEQLYPDQPTLLAWAGAVTSGFRFPEQTRKLGSSLFAIPLSIERTPPGTRVTIPSPFLPYRTDRTMVSSSLYVNRTGEWVERQTSGKTWLRIQLPEEILPIRLDRVTVIVRIRGPVTRLEIAAERDGETVVLTGQTSPVGSVELEIDDTDQLLIDREGGIKLGVVVTVPSANAATNENLDAGSINLWKIDSLRVEAEGETVAP